MLLPTLTDLTPARLFQHCFSHSQSLKSCRFSEEFVDGFVRGFTNRPDNDFTAGVMDGVQARLFLERLPHIWEHMGVEEF